MLKLKREAEERTDVIVKVGNKWRIKGKTQKYWDAQYDTKADAQAALRAYWANKKESYCVESNSTDKLEQTLNQMKDTANGIIRYGVESSNICDLLETAAENLDVDWHDKDQIVQDDLDKEMRRIEADATECCSKIIDAIDSLSPLSNLAPIQLSYLEKSLRNLNCYGAKPLDEPSEYVKCVVADYSLHEDSQSLDDLEFACENTLEEEAEDEMNESRCLESEDTDDDYLADQILIVVRNTRPLYNKAQSIIKSLVNKYNRGVEINSDILLSSSVLNDLLREAIKECRRNDTDSRFDSFPVSAKRLAKEKLTEYIMDKVEDSVR